MQKLFLAVLHVLLIDLGESGSGENVTSMDPSGPACARLSRNKAAGQRA
jgi:hypothetical protein